MDDFLIPNLKNAHTIHIKINFSSTFQLWDPGFSVLEQPSNQRLKPWRSHGVPGAAEPKKQGRYVPQPQSPCSLSDLPSSARNSLQILGALLTRTALPDMGNLWALPQPESTLWDPEQASRDPGNIKWHILEDSLEKRTFSEKTMSADFSGNPDCRTRATSSLL